MRETLKTNLVKDKNIKIASLYVLYTHLAFFTYLHTKKW